MVVPVLGLWLWRQERPAKSRVIILLTVGVHNAGQIDPMTAAQASSALDIKVYSMGVGTPGMVSFPVDDPCIGRRTRMVESKVDEDALRRVAAETVALYFRATDTEGLERIYAQISEMEKTEVKVQMFNRYKELGAWVPLPALGLLLVEVLLRRTVLWTLP